MRTIKQTDIEKALSGLEVRPDPAWQARTRELLRQYAAPAIGAAEGNPSSYSFYHGSFMNKFKIAIATVAVVVLASLATSVAADSSKPGDLLYPVDKLSEKAQIALAKLGDDLSLAHKYLDLADERLQELEAYVGGDPSTAFSFVGTAWAEDGDDEVIQGLLDEYGDCIGQALALTGDLEEGDEETDGILEEIATATVNHQQVLARIYQQAPVQARKGLENAMVKSMHGFEQAMENPSVQNRLRVREEVQNQIQEAEASMVQLKNQGANVPSFFDDEEEDTPGSGNGQGATEQEQERNTNGLEDEPGEEQEREQNQNSYDDNDNNNEDAVQVQIRQQTRDSYDDDPGQVQEQPQNQNSGDRSGLLYRRGNGHAG